MTQYYECHITMQSTFDVPVSRIKEVVESTNWKFSCIDGDPVLGTGVKCYATMLFNERNGDNDVLTKLNEVADLIGRQGIHVLRRKIERVIYDDRSDKVRFCDMKECATCNA